VVGDDSFSFIFNRLFDLIYKNITVVDMRRLGWGLRGVCVEMASEAF
jgi:hypothetical protein